MNRKFPLIFLFSISLFISKAQVYECRDFGFKFVMIHTSTPDSFYTIPLITYVRNGSPADMAGMIPGAEMLWLAGEPNAGYSKNLTGEQFLNQLNNRQYDCCLILYTTPGWQQQGEHYVSMISYTAEFPKANRSPVEGGEKLLGTCLVNCKGDVKTILFENGDTYTGNVVNKVYPDPDDINGKYETLLQKEKIKLDAENKYQAALAEKKRKEDLEKQLAQQKADEEAAALQKYYDEQAAIALIKFRQDSVINVKSINEIIGMMDAASFTNKLICGIGMDVVQTNGFWFISKVEKYGPAWLAGLKPGDRLTSVADNAKYIYDMNKFEIISKLTGNINSQVQLTFVRPTDEGNEMAVYMNCFFIYNQPASSVKGGCLTGDCANGKGIYKDGKGNIFDGNFANGKLNGQGTIIMPYDSMVVHSQFINGLKNGNTTIYTGTGSIHRRYDNYLQNNTIYFNSNFINDVPDGYGTISYNFEAYYYVRYSNGVIQGKALRLYTDNLYILCDPTPRYTLTNCMQYEGKPTDVSMMKPADVAVLNNSNNNTNNNNNINPLVSDQTTYEHENLSRNLHIALNTIQETDYDFTWATESDLIFQPDAIYDLEYVRFTVPAHKTIRINFVMEPEEVELVRFYPRHMSYLYENTDGGELSGGGQNMEGLFYWQYYTITNDYDKAGDILIEIRAVPASKYFTRTVAYSWGISK
ncbi:MAG: PDZ domain-containing protein [Chitinophagales bacterium]